MKKKTLVLITVLTLVFAVLIGSAFLDATPPDASAFLPPDYPPPSAGNPLGETAPFLTTAVTFPDGMDGFSDDALLSIRKRHETADPALAKEILALNAQLLTVIDSALEIEEWVDTSNQIGAASTSVHSAARLKFIQSFVAEENGAPDLGLSFDLEALAIFKHFVDRPSSLVAEIISTGGRRVSINNDYVKRLRSIESSEVLLQLRDTMVGLRPESQKLAATLKAEYRYNVQQFAESHAAYGQYIDSSHGIRSRLFQPNRTAREFIRMYSEAIDPILPAISRTPLTVVSPNGWSTNFAGETIVKEVAGVLPLVIDTWTKNYAKHEALIVLTAVRRYELAHKTLPNNLMALVPEYLDSEPVDPYDGKPMRYNVDKAIIYSVGTDFVDDGGDLSDGYFSEDSEPTLAIRNPAQDPAPD